MTLRKLARAVIQRAAEFILGTHPRNTVFSFNYFNVAHIRSFMAREAAKLPAGGLTVIDVGAGRSPYYDLFAARVERYVAVDDAGSLPDPEPRPIAQLTGRAERLPVPDASADIVLCHQVLEHVEDERAALLEIGRALKPGGVLLGSVPHVSSVHLEPADFRRFTDLGLERLLRRTGFTDIRIETSGGAFQAAALLLAMDWTLSPRRAGQPQSYSTLKALALSPLIGTLNLIAALCDRILPRKGRSYANLCWSATHPR